MKYSYEATTQEGKKVTGIADASDKMTLYKEMKKRGKEVLSATEMKDNWLTRANDGFSSMTTRVKMQEKITFARNLGAMLEAGLPMARALEVLQRQTKNKKFVKVIYDLSDGIKKGKTLSESMTQFPKVFPQLFISMVRAGEESGGISSSLKLVGDQLEKTLILQKKIRGAMMYPCIIFIVMAAIAVLMMIFVVPTLINTFTQQGVKLPWTTMLIVNVSNLIVNQGLILLLALIVIVVGIIFISKTPSGKKTLDNIWLHLPVIGNLVKEVNSARTTRTLSSLLSSGVDMVVSMEITEQVVQNYHFKEVIRKAKKIIQNGEAISGVFLQNQKLYPSFVGEMMSVGEETGRLAPMLMDVATYYENEVDQSTKDMSTIIEPVLMVVIGAAVGFFAISMISPIYSVMNNIK